VAWLLPFDVDFRTKQISSTMLREIEMVAITTSAIVAALNESWSHVTAVPVSPKQQIIMRSLVTVPYLHCES